MHSHRQSEGKSDSFVAMWDATNTLAWAVAEGVGAQRCEPGDVDALSADGIFLTGFFEGTATFGQGQPTETVLESNGEHDGFLVKVAVP